MKKRFLPILVVFIAGIMQAQNPAEINTTIVNGFNYKSEGKDFYYHSSVPVARESLLIRATDGNSSMEWITSPAPEDIGTDFLSFAWLAGVGSSPGRASFDLAVNGKHRFTFWADGTDQWLLTADDGSSLWFQKDMIDQHGDRFGFMFLTIPANLVRPGEPLSVRVTGGKHGLTSWYMTFKFPLEAGLNFKALPAIIDNEDGQHQLGVAGILHFSDPATARIFIDNKLVNESIVGFGYNYIRVDLPAVTEKTDAAYRLEIDGRTWEGTLPLYPVRHWRVNFVQHTHTDIGYTRPQTEILAEHLRFIDYALDYCDMTDDYPDAAKFRWSCEASWAVDEYLKCRPADQVERLKKRAAEDRIEITGMYFNFSELPDEQNLAASLQPLRRFRDAGLTVKTAMQNDVNGMGWCLNDFYHDLGVRYLNMGTHGHRALICFDKPTLFWWESPSGKRMLAFRAEHYMTGNTVFKIHAGDFNVFEDELLTYLASLEAKGYEYDLISIQHSGFTTDNSPPSTFASDMIRQWNEKYAWPQLKTATATEFFEEMERDHGDSFPVIRGAWPDWWTDGFGASAREVAAIRKAQSDLLANTTGLTMATLLGAVMPEKVMDRIQETNSALLFYTEHTVGYHGSIREPFHHNTMEQRALKESYAWEAIRRAKMLGEETMGMLQSFIHRENEPSLVVYNTLSWPHSGLLRVYIDHQLIPRYTSFSITDQKGNSAKTQAVEHHSGGTYWAIWVDDIPAFGFKKYIITLHEDRPAKDLPAENPRTCILENQWYRIVTDQKEGALTSIYDKELNIELVDKGAEWKLGQFIYEMLDNREQMELFKLDNYKREVPDSIWYEGMEQGDIWNALRFRGNTRAAIRNGDFHLEIRLFNTAKRIDLLYSIEKKLVTDPEGIYIAFPFTLENGQIAFNVPGGEVRAGIDQIPGSSNDWNTVQHYARLSNEDAQVILCSPEIPLMQFGGINTGRYQAGALPETTHIFGWPMNNYWTTNFNADQHGGHEWTYVISSCKGNNVIEAAKFGWGIRAPFLTRVLPGGGNGEEIWEGSFITGWPDNLLLICAMPSSNGLSAIFHVRELAGESCYFNLLDGRTGKTLHSVQTDVTGNPLANGSLELKPYESRFFRVNF